jgi:HEAT repeat protein
MSRILAVCLSVLVAAATGAEQRNARVQELIDQLKDRNEVVRLKAAKELGQLKERAKDAIPALTIAASRDSDEDVRAVASRSLEAIKDAVAEHSKDRLREVLTPLVRDLKSKNAVTRLSALNKLGDMGTQARDAGADVVEFGILNSPPTIQEAATATLEKIDPEAHKYIVTILVDKEKQNKLRAIQSLEALGRKGKSGMPALKYYYTQLITNDYFGGDQAGLALHAMTKIAPDDKAVIDTVLGLVSMPVPGQRAAHLPRRSLAIQLLPEVRTDNRKRVVVLVAALNDAACRAQAAHELGKLGPDAKDAVPVLTKLKLDPDREVRAAAAAALTLITD